MDDFGTQLTFIVRLFLGFASTLFVTGLPVAQASQCPYQENCDVVGVHHVVRRSASSSASQSLQVDFVPLVQNVTYYNTGNEISFRLNLTHNTSVSADMTQNLRVVVSSQFLEPKSGSLVQSSGSVSNEILNSSAISFDVASLPSAQVVSVTFMGIVKDTIHPLANLYFVVHVTGNDGSNDYHFGPVSSLPTLYAVFPKVSLSRDSYSHLWVSSTTLYTLTITMPKLNFSLLVEISTAINDFSFMELTNVIVTSVGTNINIGSGGGTKSPSPQYDASEGVSFKDRAVLDFGNLTVAGHEAINNRIVIKYNVTIWDHPMLSNNSKHWVGAGMRSGYQMLWVGQEALYVYKNEPSVTGEVKAMNDTTNKRYLIGDRLYVNWTVSHTYNTSYEDAQDVSVTFYSKTLKLISGTYEKSADGTQETLPITDLFRSDTINITTLAKGNTVYGTLALEVSERISPLESLDVFMELRYKNIRGEEKMNTTHKVSPPYLAGVPRFSLELNSSTNRIRIGGRAKFSFTVEMRNMISTIKVEVILPVNDSSSIMSLINVRVLSVGSKIENHTAHSQTQPQFESTVGDPKLYDRATMDFGTVKSVTTEGNSSDDEILIEFEVIINDHTNVTNGSKHWVGVGVRGGETMMWIGEVALIADVPTDRRPVLQVQGSCEVPGSQLSCKDATMLQRNSKVYFNGTVFHDESSQQYADNVKILWMIPPYVTFDKLHNDPGMSYEMTNGGPRFTFSQKLHFLDRLTFSGEGSLDPKGIMPPGDTYAVSPIQLTYSPYSMSAVFGAPLAPVSFKFRSPGEGEPTETLGHLQEEYNRGFLFDTIGNTVYICQKSNDRLKSSCFSTSDGSSWMAIDQQVCSIIGQNGSSLYAISCNGRAYMERRGMNGAWYGISHEKWKYVKTENPNIQQNLRTIPDDYASDEIAPSPNETVGSAIQWGATMKGVSTKDSGIWQLKAQWKCCGS